MQKNSDFLDKNKQKIQYISAFIPILALIFYIIHIFYLFYSFNIYDEYGKNKVISQYVFTSYFINFIS